MSNKIISIRESVEMDVANIARQYIETFEYDMSTAELIGAYRKLIDLKQATDDEECALLDLLMPSMMRKTD